MMVGPPIAVGIEEDFDAVVLTDLRLAASLDRSQIIHERFVAFEKEPKS
jgi:hypothetical protein